MSVKLVGSRTVHRDTNCVGFNAVADRSKIIDTVEEITCKTCLGTQSRPGPKPKTREVVRVIPVTETQPLPPRYSEILKRQALSLLETAILMERDGL